MVMEMEQEFEWLEAQKIEISVDLVAAAKRQLQFLAAVDRNRWLYEGPALQRAIYRYNTCWLPMLAKHSESQISEGPLIVPLDCEWVWHCHRLNPVRYKSDCEELYGRILDNSNVVSSVKGSCNRQTEDIWNRLYPEEPYNLDLARALSEDISNKFSELEKYTKYDLVSAVKRQSPFFYQVSRAHMNNDIFLEEAVARYKGFLHLIKRNKKRSMKCMCVPTYDIDLIWHRHQLHSACYCKDLSNAIGKVLEHDDMDADRTKGKKLDVGFSGTTAQWEEIFGTRYWKAGAMHRGNAPSPLTTIPLTSDFLRKDLVAANECQNIIQLPEMKFVEVLLEIVGVKNLPDGQKQFASFQCELTGELLFELMSRSPSNLPVTMTFKMMGTTSFSLQEFLVPVSKLSLEKWLELTPSTGNVASKPICLRVALSFTTPTKGPSVLHMIRSPSLSKSTCFFPLLGKAHRAKSWTRVVDGAQAEVISLQMRDSTKEKARENCIPRKQIKIFPGRKLDYELKHCEKQRGEQDFMTAVEFSLEHPYGKAVALLDLKFGYVRVKEDWLVLPGIVLAFILYDILKRKGYDSITAIGKYVETDSTVIEKPNGFCKEDHLCRN